MKASVGVVAWVKDEVRWEQKGSLEKCLSPVTVPIQLAMTLTMPVVREGRLTKGYSTVRTHGYRSPRIGSQSTLQISVQHALDDVASDG